jgi:NAD(P)-dependent dehydrogenase (short-subunit alcohol dehydrogenase family)
MKDNPPLISTGELTQETLKGQVAIVTGAGRGIGVEAARALLWLGTNVIVAEIDLDNGKRTTDRLKDAFGHDRVLFVHTDVGDQRSVQRLARRAFRTFGKVDIVLNNATIAPLGAVTDVPIGTWDASYRVNLRGPVLLAQAFLPAMLKRDYGVFVCVGSAGEAYMGAYETYKAAQMHLGNVLSAELENTGVSVFSIGPGIVRTPGAESGIAAVAPLYGMSVEEFYALSEAHLISVEAAGAGFAAAIALAHRYRGQEVGSVQALHDAGISIPEKEKGMGTVVLNEAELEQALALCRQVHTTLDEQSKGWQERPLFERQWMFRDFQKQTGGSVDRWLEALKRLEGNLEAKDRNAMSMVDISPEKLAKYYERMGELAKGYEKDPQRLEESLKAVRSWQETVENLIAVLQLKT